jgi:hypothetical protein
VSAESVREYYRKQGREYERERIINLLEGLDTEQWCGTNLQIAALINEQVHQAKLCDTPNKLSWN